MTRALPLLCLALLLAAPGAPAQVVFEGAEAGLPGALSIREIPGPYPGLPGWQAEEGAAQIISVAAPEPPGSRGSVMLWIRIEETLQSGRDVDGFSTDMLHAPGVFRLSLDHRPDAVQIYWDWAAGAPEGWEMRTLLPELPGPGWVHLAFRWDAEEGTFDSYLNGTPVRLPRTPVDAWEAPEAAELELTAGPLAFAGLEVFDDAFEEDRLRSSVPSLYHGTLEHLLGARELGTADLAARKGALIYESALDGESSVDGWVMEGPGEVRFEDGWMTMSSRRPDGPEGHHVFWNPVDFPERFLAEWTIQPLSDYGLCIVFFAAGGAGGEDLFDASLQPREGVFARYTEGDVASYHISYYANTPFNPGRITANMRRNPGVFLVSNGPPGIPTGSTDIHTIRLMKDGGHVVLTVDDRIVIEYEDDGTRHGPVLGEGKIGLRQMQWMQARYRDFRVYELE